MKTAKILAIAMVAVISLSSFAGCASMGITNNAIPEVASSHLDNNDIASPPDVDTYEENSHIERSGDEIVSGIEEGVSELEESIGLRDDEVDPYESEGEISRIESRDVSREESVAAAMSADFSEIGALSGQKDTGFPGGPVDEKNRPSGPVSYQNKYGKYGAYFIVPDSNKIYLTFDEGYENGYTSRILDILKEKNVKAVFFITYPYAKTEPALVSRMIAEGHTIGNHSTKHLVFPDMPLEEAAKDIMTLHDYVLANYGYEMSLFRPPEGAFSEQTLALAQSLGYNTMLWSFAYKDYDAKDQPIALEALDNIVKKAHPGEICLLHAVSKTNAEILGEVIDTLREKGATFADYFYFQ